MNYNQLSQEIWNYLEIGQYENPIDSESLSEKISEDVYDSVKNKMITEDELDKLNELWDTGIEWGIM